MHRSALLIALLVPLLGACKEDAELLPELNITATQLDFGEVPVGQEAIETFTLSNDGGGEIELLSVQLTDGDPDRFDVDREGSLLLAADLTLEVSVTFSPRDEDRELGLIQIRYDDGESGTLSVDLIGEGSPSEADEDGDGVQVNEGDCDDGDPNTYPGAEELCDGRDNDCDGRVDADESDSDSDGVRVCEGDCDDADRLVYPGADEICDGKDSDCDGVEGDDADLDGDGATVCDGDCDDGDAAISPYLAEICDGLDNDCSGSEDDIDLDGDGHSTCSGAGDCDDDDPTAYPVVLDPSYTGNEELGTDEAPYRSLDDALADLDEICREVWMAEGSYELNLTLGGADDFTLVGESAAGVIITSPSGQRAFDLSGGASLGLVDLTLSGGTGSGDGGAIRLVDSSLDLDGVTLIGNTSTGDGGALSASSSTVTAQSCTFDSNTAVDDGGAIALLSATFVDAGSTYTSNSGVRGGAIVSDGSSIDLSDATLRSNSASDKGGGVAVIGGSLVQIERCDFALNAAVSSGGGLSFTDVNAPGAVRNNLIHDNNGGAAGGGVAITGSVANFDFVNNTLFANLASGEGAGVSLTASSGSVEMKNNVVGWSDGSSGLYVSALSSHNITYNTVYATISGDDFDGVVADSATQNRDADPLFNVWSDNRDPDDDDLTLGSGSHCINSGDPSSAYNDQDGTQNDRGYTGGPAAP